MAAFKAHSQPCNLTIQDLLAHPKLSDKFSVLGQGCSKRREVPLCLTCLWEIGKHEQYVQVPVAVPAAAAVAPAAPPPYTPHGWKTVQRFAMQRMCRRFRDRIARRKEARALRVFGDLYLPPDLLNIAVEYVGSDEVSVPAAATPSMERTCFSPTVSANRSLSLSTTR